VRESGTTLTAFRTDYSPLQSVARKKLRRLSRKYSQMFVDPLTEKFLGEYDSSVGGFPVRIGSVALVSCLLAASTAGYASTPDPRVPMGVYVNFITSEVINRAQVAAYPGLKTLPPYPNPSLTPDPTDAIMVAYFTTLLDNPAISGLAPQIGWQLLNPENPGPNAADPNAGAYTWNALDDIFTAVDQWNKAHADLAPKTIQLIISPGYNSPAWVFSDIDGSVCGTGIVEAGCTGSCDGLFMTPPPLLEVSKKCGYTTLFYRTEGDPVEQLPLPMPWNAVYKNDWQTFLVALNKHVLTEPSSSAFVSINMAGPTASSTEMILPNQGEEGPYEKNGLLVLKSGKGGVVPPGEKAVGFDVPGAWNTLFYNFYGSNPEYHNSDQPFIEE
jgi:hypothetical protein